MREIKFRDYNPETKEIRHFDLDHYNKEDHNAWGNITQFTGLKDKNGVEVYEGDIITCASRMKCPHEVIWMKEVPSSAILGGMPGFYLSSLNQGYSFIGEEEIIGNIYSNPEILKEKK